MGRGDAPHSDTRRDGRWLRRGGTTLVVLLLVLAGLSHVYDLGPRYLGWEDPPSPVTEPAEVAPPPGLTLPAPSPAAPVAATSPTGTPDPAAVRRAVARLVRDKDLGRRVAVAVGDPVSGGTVLETGPPVVTPASTLKILTSTAALAALGPDHTFRTTVVAGASPGQVVLVGGGDPLLARAPVDEAYPARADIVTLARQTARSLKGDGVRRVRLGYDTSLFTGPSVSPAWPASYVSANVVSRITPLWVDEGRERSGVVFRAADPALGAATEFARVLRRQGIVVRGAPRPTIAPDGAAEHAAVESAPLAQIVQWVLEVSDNEAAEVLFRHVAIAEGQPASFTGGSAAVTAVLGRLGVDLAGARLHDGSGLSRQNLLAPRTLLHVVGLAASEEHPELRRVVSGLPVAGFTGSLTYRFTTSGKPALGRVRAKTGTLTGVHGLAGVVTDLEGTVLTFVVVADRVRLPKTLDARERIDQIAGALASCRCTR